MLEFYEVRTCKKVKLDGQGGMTISIHCRVTATISVYLERKRQ